MSRPKRTIYPVNGSGGDYVSIPLTVNGAKYVEIVECPPTGGNFTGGNYAPQGINYELPDDSYTAVYGLNPGSTLSFGESDAISNPGHGPGLGFTQRPDVGNPGVNIPGTTYCKVRSATVTATQVECREYD